MNFNRVIHFLFVCYTRLTAALNCYLKHCRSDFKIFYALGLRAFKLNFAVFFLIQWPRNTVFEISVLNKLILCQKKLGWTSDFAINI